MSCPSDWELGAEVLVGQASLDRSMEQEMKLKLGITDEEFINDNEAIEVRLGHCLEISFLNFENGKKEIIYWMAQLGTPYRPRLNGYLYVGQGIPKPKREWALRY